MKGEGDCVWGSSPHSCTYTYHCTQEKTRLMSSNLKLLRRFFEYLDAAGNGSIGVRELEEPLISVVGSQAGVGCVGVSHNRRACVRAKLMFVAFSWCWCWYTRYCWETHAPEHHVHRGVCLLVCAGLGCVTR